MCLTIGCVDAWLCVFVCCSGLGGVATALLG